MVSQTDEKKEPKKKKSKLKILCIVALIAIVACTCGYFNVEIKNAVAQMSKEEMKSMTFPSLTVNLAGANKNSYLKTTITLEYVSSKKLDKEMEEKSYKVTDCILKVLRNTTAAALSNPQETELLKQELLIEINSTLTSGKVTGLYFEEFIVQ